MRKFHAVTLAISVFLVTAPAGAATFVVRPGAPNQVVFTSKATAETFQGRTDKISGHIAIDPSAVSDSVTVLIEVDMASFDTGLGKRDQHMRDNHLETKKYPKATFQGATLKSGAGALVAGTPVTFDVEGAFTLHGVTRRMRATVEVVLKDAGTLEFKTGFPVALADYQIDRPKFLFMKLADVQQVEVNGTARLSAAQAASP